MMRFSAVAAFVAALVYVVAVFFVAAAGSAGSGPARYEVTFHLQRVHSDGHIHNEFITRSTPGNANFRKWLSPMQITELYQAPADVIEAATALATQSGICATAPVLSAAKDMLTCVVSRDATPAAHGAIAAQFAKTTALAPSVTVKQLPAMRAMARLCRTVIAYRPVAKGTSAVRLSSKLGEPGMTQTPHTLNARYEVPAASTLNLDKDLSVGVAEFEASYYSPSDLAMFSQRYLGGRPVKTKNMGPWQPAGAGAGAVEGTLDLEYVTSVNNATLPTYWLAQSMNGGGGEPGSINFAKIFDQIAALDDLPGVVSISWGLAEQHYDLARDDMTEAAAAFAKCGLRGISVFAASGDSGPGSRNGIFDCTSFTPSFPASAPTLTTVGATYANSQSSAEVCVDWSGGGFSNQFGMPDWQRDAVANYIKTAANMPKASFYNASGRAYPDVGAAGTNFLVSVGGQWMPVSGTSAASPTFAGVVGLIQSERKAAGKPLLGFINPVIYQAGKVGYDVVEGQTYDQNCFPIIPEKGFPAAVGFDCTTGLGTPRYPVLKQVLDF